jgi:hypothetical protein
VVSNGGCGEAGMGEGRRIGERVGAGEEMVRSTCGVAVEVIVVGVGDDG